MTHSGDWIVLMDGWTSPVDSNDTLFENYTYTPRLFISKIGSNHWDTIVPPAKTRIRMLYADEGASMWGRMPLPKFFSIILLKNHGT